MKNGQLPIIPHDFNQAGTLGLTKREYFAGLAMQGLCADSNITTIEKITELSVRLADNLLKELEK